VIVDLRHNPGGLLQSATRIADQFLSTGRLVSTKVRSTPIAEFNAHPEGEYLEGDLVILVNRYSASAAEIVSGAIKDWGRGLIIGERTYGKGSVQHVITIKKEKAYLKLTAAHYYLPSGRLLHKTNGSESWGVDPDVKVQLTPKQAKRWLDLRRKTDLLQEIDPDQLASDLTKQYEADLPLSTAVVLLRLMQLQQPEADLKAAA
jgi:carboxyl-terminal processing protease